MKAHIIGAIVLAPVMVMAAQQPVKPQASSTQQRQDFRNPFQNSLVGSEAPFDIKFTDDIKSDAVKRVRGVSVRQGGLVIRRPGASFLKLHFSEFDLPKGASLTLSNENGTEVYHYGSDASLRDGITFDRTRGDDGVRKFSPMSVSGDYLELRVVNNPKSAPYRVVIDRIIEGNFDDGQGLATARFLDITNTSRTFSGDREPQPTFDTCGSVKYRKDAVCFQNSHQTEYERTRPIARIITTKGGGTYTCTAWRVGPNNRMFTNNHCVNSQTQLDNSEIWFNHQKTQCGGSELAPITKITADQLFKTNADLDYSLFSVNNFASISGWGYFGLEVRDPNQGEQIYIPQHGAGNPKELSIESDFTPTGNCQVKYANMTDKGVDAQAGYQCDTTGGSSGSPVLVKSTNNVIALHHWGGCTDPDYQNVNRGVQISSIWPEVSQYFNGVPVGDNSDNTGTSPSADFGFSVQNLTVSFSNQSSHPNGVITDYTWDFGDGNSSNTANPTHSYASAGSYQVTLTVTDSNGKQDLVSKTVQLISNTTQTLNNGDVVSGISGSKDQWQLYKIVVPAEAQNLDISISGGNGDADLYVQLNSTPDLQSYQCRPWKFGNNESCTYEAPNQAEYVIGLHGYDDFSGVSLSVSYEEANNNLEYIDLSGLQGNKDGWTHFSLNVPSNKSKLRVTLSGGSGDPDLYLGHETIPTKTSYSCRSQNSGSSDGCTMNNPVGGTWYISIFGYSAYSGLRLQAYSE